MKKKQTRSASKKARAVQSSPHLHVAGHRHTGHILPRRNTSYPVLLMIVLCVGVLLFSWTRVVTADSASYTVNASVPGPAPTVPASVNSPSNGSQFTATPITVTGSCPQNTYVVLLRNGVNSGVALCDANGTYLITTDLFKGTNQLVARDYNFTDVPGPDSATVTVYYNPPNAGGSTSGDSTTSITYTPGSSNIPEPLLLKTNFTLLGYYAGQTASWQVRLEGGTTPYAVAVDWGDGKHSLYSRSSAGTLSLQHVYKQAGGYKGSYVVRITASDADGNETVLQLIAIVNDRAKTVVNGINSANPGAGSGLFGGGSIGRIIGYSWTGYGIVILMLFSFWLGERREFGLLQPIKRRRHA